MDNTVILNNIIFNPDIDKLIDKLCISDRPADREKFTELARHARTVAKPKAMYKIAYIDSKTDDHAVIEGITLRSHILCVNLKEVHRVFPFVATCGRELYDWSQTIDDMLERFWVDTIMEEAVHMAFEECKQHIEAHLQTGQTSFMEPGSLEDWPVKLAELRIRNPQRRRRRVAHPILKHIVVVVVIAAARPHAVDVH